MILLTVVLVFCSCVVKAVPQSEIDAVHAMAEVWTGTWSQTNNNVCSFSGVLCDDDEQHIISVIIDNTVLESVPEAIAGLKYLRFLRLQSAQITTISSVVFQLPRLDHLDLTRNEVSSLPIPSTNLSASLSAVTLPRNRLTSLPEAMFLFPGLQTLDVSVNNIKLLDIPEIVTATSLQTLNLRGNNLTSLPESISKLTGLKYLDVGSNQIQKLVDELFDLPLITRLDVSDNNLTSGILRCLTSFSNLRQLSLRRNQIEEPFPQTLSNLGQLESLSLEFNRISGSLPSAITAPSLSTLLLGRNRLSGPLPEFTDSHLLTTIQFTYNDFQGTIPLSYGGLQSLEQLHMSYNPRLTGQIPVELGALQQLQSLFLSNTNLYGVFPSCLHFSDSIVSCTIDVEDFECGVSPECGINKPCPADKQDLCVCNSNMTECGCGSPDFHCEGSSGCVGVGQCAALIGESSSSNNHNVSDKIDDDTNLVVILIAAVGGTVVVIVIVVLTALLIVRSKKQKLQPETQLATSFDQKARNGTIDQEAYANAPAAHSNLNQQDTNAVSAPYTEGHAVYANTPSAHDKSSQTVAAMVSGYDKIYAPIPKATEIHHEINSNDVWMTGRKLGEGSFGVVWEGEYKGKDVAVKEVLEDRVDEKELEEFMQEANLMMAMGKHAHVVEFIGIVREPLFIVTEFMHLGDLKSLLNKRDAELRTRKIDILFDVSKGMAFLASKGIVHRDLAARNVLLDKNYRATVADFGLARLLNREGSAYTASNVGPVRWMAPEAITRKKGSEKSDVWMFGILCYEVFSDGALPFDGYGNIQVCSMIPQGKYPDFPSTVPSLFADKFIGNDEGQLFALEDTQRPTFKQVVDFVSSNIDAMKPQAVSGKVYALTQSSVSSIPETNPYNRSEPLEE